MDGGGDDGPPLLDHTAPQVQQAATRLLADSALPVYCGLTGGALSLVKRRGLNQVFPVQLLVHFLVEAHQADLLAVRRSSTTHAPLLLTFEALLGFHRSPTGATCPTCDCIVLQAGLTLHWSFSNHLGYRAVRPRTPTHLLSVLGACGLSTQRRNDFTWPRQERGDGGKRRFAPVDVHRLVALCLQIMRARTGGGINHEIDGRTLREDAHDAPATFTAASHAPARTPGGDAAESLGRGGELEEEPIICTPPLVETRVGSGAAEARGTLHQYLLEPWQLSRLQACHLCNGSRRDCISPQHLNLGLPSDNCHDWHDDKGTSLCQSNGGRPARRRGELNAKRAYQAEEAGDPVVRARSARVKRKLH